MDPQIRHTLLLAYGIAEWQSTIDHIDAMKEVGVVRWPDVRYRMCFELDLLINRYEEEEISDEEPVLWARQYLADQPVELLQLLAREVNDGQGETVSEVGLSTAGEGAP